MLFVLLFHQSIYVAQVASLLVVVESVANDEVVRNLHCGIFDVQINRKFSGLSRSVQICTDSGLRVPSESIMRFIVSPLSTISSRIITVLPEMSSLMPITSLIFL